MIRSVFYIVLFGCISLIPFISHSMEDHAAIDRTKRLSTCEITKLENEVLHLISPGIVFREMTPDRKEKVIHDFITRLESQYRLLEEPELIKGIHYKGKTKDGQSIPLRSKGKAIDRILGIEHAQRIIDENSLSIKLPKKFVYRDHAQSSVRIECNFAFRNKLTSDNYLVFAEEIRDSQKEITLKETMDIATLIQMGGLIDLGGEAGVGFNLIKSDDGLYLIDAELKSFNIPHSHKNKGNVGNLLRYPNLSSEAKAWIQENYSSGGCGSRSERQNIQRELETELEEILDKIYLETQGKGPDYYDFQCTL